MITSASNKQIKNILQLQKKSKARNESKTFVIEGIKMYIEIPKDMIESTFISESFYNDKYDKYSEYINSYEVVKDSVFNEISETMTPQGIIAIVRQPEYDFETVISKEKTTLLVLDDLRDPGNMGTIIRTAEGAGVDGVVISKESVDMFNPKVIRSTMGAIFRMPFVYVDNLEQTLNEYKEKGFILYAAHLEGAVDYTNIEYDAKIGIVIGNEANGISDSITKLSNHMIKIPMEGKVESLNAAISAAVIMYEVYRQRKL